MQAAPTLANVTYLQQRFEASQHVFIICPVRKFDFAGAVCVDAIYAVAVELLQIARADLRGPQDKQSLWKARDGCFGKPVALKGVVGAGPALRYAPVARCDDGCRSSGLRAANAAVHREGGVGQEDGWCPWRNGGRCNGGKPQRQR